MRQLPEPATRGRGIYGVLVPEEVPAITNDSVKVAPWRKNHTVSTVQVRRPPSRQLQIGNEPAWPEDHAEPAWPEDHAWQEDDLVAEDFQSEWQEVVEEAVHDEPKKVLPLKPVAKQSSLPKKAVPTPPVFDEPPVPPPPPSRPRPSRRARDFVFDDDEALMAEAELAVTKMLKEEEMRKERNTLAQVAKKKSMAQVAKPEKQETATISGSDAPSFKSEKKSKDTASESESPPPEKVAKLPRPRIKVEQVE